MKDYSGKDWETVKKELTEKGIQFRIIQLNHKALAVTDDFIPERLNFKLINGIVAGVENG